MEDSLLHKIKELEPPETEFDVSLPLIKSSSGTSYYAKIGQTYEKEQFTGESESLRHISAGAPGLAPRVFSQGLEENGRPFFISEYKQLSPLTTASAKRLAERLATELHTHTSQQGFGFSVPTFCGRTRQANGWYDTWEGCYDALIAGLLEGLSRRASGSNKDLCEKGEQIRR